MSPLAKGDIHAPKGDIGDLKGDSMESPNPSLDPPNRPIERDARERGKESGTSARSDKIPDAELLAKLRAIAPTTAHDSVAETDAAWLRLDHAERKLAVERYPDWLAAKGARKAISGLPVYLGEKRWTLLPAKAADGAVRNSAKVAAFSRAWWWCLHRIVATNLADWGNRSPGVQSEIRIRWDAARKFAGGWPVNPDKHDAIVTASEALRQVPKDGPEASAWRDYYRGLGIDMPIPDFVHWIFVPAELPAAREDVGAVAERALG